MAPLTLNVNGRDVTFTEPGKARAAARRWSRMAGELDPLAGPDVQEKIRELRARAKAANDWARRTEDARPTEAPTEGDQPAPADEAKPERRRRAAGALVSSGVKRGRARAGAAQTRTKRANRRYVAAGGFDATSLGEFAVYLIGSIVVVLLVEDALSKTGSSAFAKATQAASQVSHKIIAPVPLINAHG